jgi:hypothetical protein
MGLLDASATPRIGDAVTATIGSYRYMDREVPSLVWHPAS